MDSRWKVIIIVVIIIIITTTTTTTINSFIFLHMSFVLSTF